MSKKRSTRVGQSKGAAQSAKTESRRARRSGSSKKASPKRRATAEAAAPLHHDEEELQGPEFDPGRDADDGTTTSKRERGDVTERTVLALIRDVREGRLSGQMLVKQDRIRIVEHLTAEGYSASEIAEILKVTERTVNRDRRDARAQNALAPSPALVGEVVGQLMKTAEQVSGRLRRIGRESNAKAADRVEAELGVWRVNRELVQSLQSLGYLPTAATQINARVMGDTQVPIASELFAELERLAGLPDIVAADGTTVVPHVIPQKLDEMRAILARAAVAEQLESLPPTPPPPHAPSPPHPTPPPPTHTQPKHDPSTA
jgi:DNA-binding CsgD family transcriptional regulator